MGYICGGPVLRVTLGLGVGRRDDTCRRRRKAQVRLPMEASAVNNCTGRASEKPGLTMKTNINIY